MTAAEQEWTPGDPLMPDNGCGAMVSPSLTLEERRQALAEDDTPPPWWRPESDTTGLGYVSSRHCRPCGVRWRGDDPCWMCGGEESP
jgi:hypothetical protein